jgi:hypothetical protein
MNLKTMTEDFGKFHQKYAKCPCLDEKSFFLLSLWEMADACAEHVLPGEGGQPSFAEHINAGAQF